MRWGTYRIRSYRRPRAPRRALPRAPARAIRPRRPRSRTRAAPRPGPPRPGRPCRRGRGIAMDARLLLQAERDAQEIRDRDNALGLRPERSDCRFHLAPPHGVVLDRLIERRRDALDRARAELES